MPIAVPYFSNQELKQKADEFRLKHQGDILPVDIEHIIEIDLGIDIFPIAGLHDKCNADALISSDWKTIYIDNDNYLDDRYYNRLRFSLAHEIGHYILHRDLYNSFNIRSIEDFYKVIENIGDEYGIIEGQANRLASFMLVPREKLLFEKDRILNKNTIIGGFDIFMINAYVSIPLSKIFGVSQEVIEIALNNSCN